MATATSLPNLYVFKVKLADAKRLWRRIEVRGSQTLDHLHRAIFKAFDRFDEHLYSFYVPPADAKGRARVTQAVEYTHPYRLEESPFGLTEHLHDAAKTRLDALGLVPGQKFDYLFDFGDSWEHEIVVEKTNGVPARGARYPRVSEKRGESPPQYPDPDEPDEQEEAGGGY
jgi:hypothetical protein